VLASIRSAAVLGIAAYDVTVEVDVAAGLPAWTIVGLASSAVKEARERVTAALNNSGFSIPSRRVVCNLSPDNDAKAESAHAAIAVAEAAPGRRDAQRRKWRQSRSGSVSANRGALQTGKMDTSDA
jgi:hypothetical protein